MVKVFLTSSPL